MIERAREAANDVYAALNMAPQPRSRKAENVKVRAAIVCSLMRYMSDEKAGEVVEKDRTTCLHHRAKHLNNLKGWAGYAEIYKLANGIISLSMGDTIKQGRIESIKTRIKYFEGELVDLRESLELLEMSSDIR
tara:strand:+ start:1468 stop:1866 length:399 start_codon:yes stop_codon:yes gene_type:complete